MPVFQLYDPLSAAADAVGAGLTQINNDKNARAANAKQDAKDAQAQANADRDFNLQSKVADANIANTNSEIGSRATHDKIDKAAADYEASVRPIQTKLLQLQVQVQQGQISQQKADLANAALQHQIDQITLNIQKKYGDQTAQLAIQQAQANIASIQAGTALTDAETKNVKAGRSATGGGASGPNDFGLSPSDNRTVGLLQSQINNIETKNQRLISLIMTSNPGMSIDEATAQAQKSKGWQDDTPFQNGLTKIYNKYGLTVPTDTTNAPTAEQIAIANQMNSDIAAGKLSYDEAVNGIKTNHPENAAIIPLLKKPNANTPAAPTTQRDAREQAAQNNIGTAISNVLHTNQKSPRFAAADAYQSNGN